MAIIIIRSLSRAVMITFISLVKINYLIARDMYRTSLLDNTVIPSTVYYI